MEDHADLEQRLWALIENADWPVLVPRLQAYIRTHLSQYGEGEGRRWQSITHSYAMRTVQAALDDGVAFAQWRPWGSLFSLLCEIAGQLIDDDERRIKERLETTPWEDIIPRVLAHTVRQLGSRPGPDGKTPEDYVYEAIVQLFTRRRHFPIDRDVSLFTFLCKTVHGMRTNDMSSLAAKGQHVAAEDDASFDEAEPGGVIVSTAAADDTVASDSLERFLASLEPKLREYALLRVSEKYQTAQEYADALGVSVATIRNYDRRLRRRRGSW